MEENWKSNLLNCHFDPSYVHSKIVRSRSKKGSNDTSQMVAITVIAPAMTVFSHRGRVLLC